MRRIVANFVRKDDGATAVEYSVVLALLIAAVAGGAFWLHNSITEPTTKVAAVTAQPVVAENSGRASTTMIPSTQSPKLAIPQPEKSSGDSLLPWVLVSLAVTIGVIGIYLTSHYVMDWLGQRRTMRVVRQSLLQRAAKSANAKSDAEPIWGSHDSGTNLIGRQGPDLHHWFAGREASESAELAEFAGLRIAPETTEQINLTEQFPVQ